MQNHIIRIENGKIPSISIQEGDTIVWENFDTVPHQIGSDTGGPGFQFDAGILFPGESSSPVVFSFNNEAVMYGCGLVPNINALIKVGSPPQAPNNGGHDGHHHGHEHLKHFHGFVTGGRSGDRIYMTHTPIFADERHHFQIILQASFKEQKHREIYNNLRNSEYGHGYVQLFFDHVALIDIQSNHLKELTLDSLRYYPDVPTIRPNLVMRAVRTEIPELKGATIRIDHVLHFRTFDPDMPYPKNLTYLMYGNEEDVFIDHFISRAPNFHSVAKLASPPSFWKDTHHHTTLKIEVPSITLVDVSPKTIKRVAFLDNKSHLVWGMPSGGIAPVDPLAKLPVNTEGNRVLDDVIVDGNTGSISISHLHRFDATMLLNDGLGYTLPEKE